MLLPSARERVSRSVPFAPPSHRSVRTVGAQRGRPHCVACRTFPGVSVTTRLSPYTFPSSASYIHTYRYIHTHIIHIHTHLRTHPSLFLLPCRGVYPRELPRELNALYSGSRSNRAASRAKRAEGGVPAHYYVRSGVVEVSLNICAFLTPVQGKTSKQATWPT